MYLRNPGPIREYLTPGVEVVSVDPDCVYNSPDSVDEEDEELQTDSEEEEEEDDVTDSSDEDFIIDVEECRPRTKRQAVAASALPTSSMVTFCPTTTTTPAIPSNQTCLENIYNDNFDLAAYITDNDFDFQTTVDNTEDIVNQIASTIDHCSTSQMLVSASTVDPGSLHAAPSTSHQSFGFAHVASTTTSFAAAGPATAVPFITDADAALFVDPTDNYHYVEKWLESCLQDEKSTVETINAVAGVMGVSPLKLDRELASGPPVFFDVKQSFCQALFNEPILDTARNPVTPTKCVAPSPKRSLPIQQRALPAKKAAPLVGKGRGKNISMYSMFREDEASTQCPAPVSPVVTKRVLPEPATLTRGKNIRGVKATTRPVQQIAKPPSEVDIDVVVDSDDDDDDDSVVDSYTPSHSGASSSGSSVNVVSRPTRASVLLAKKVQQPPAKKPTKSTKVTGPQPSKRKFRSKSYISSSSSNSGSEANVKIQNQEPKTVLPRNPPASKSIKPVLPEKPTKIEVPKKSDLSSATKTTTTKSITSKVQSGKIVKRATSMDSVVRPSTATATAAGQLKRKLSIVSSDSNDPSGFLDDLLRSRKPLVKRDANRKTVLARSAAPFVLAATRVEKQVSLLKKSSIAKRTTNGVLATNSKSSTITTTTTTTTTNKITPTPPTTTPPTVDIPIDTHPVKLEEIRKQSKVNEFIKNELMETDDLFVSNEELVVDDDPAQQKKRLNLDEYLKRRRVAKAPATDPARTAQRDHLARMEQQNKARAKDEKELLHNQNLVELVVVSMGCNTDITISNTSSDDTTPSHLINNINDTIIKAHNENVKINSNSLIASIQDVLIKKCIPSSSNVDDTASGVTPNASVAAVSSATEGATKSEHGEDKVIMYLPKDRRKVLTKSVECQTENLLQFPTLQRMRRPNRNYRKRTDSRHSYRSRSRSNSSASDRRRYSSYDDDSDSSDASDYSAKDRHRTSNHSGGGGGYRSGNSRFYPQGGQQQTRSRLGSYRNSLSRSESETTESEENLRLHHSTQKHSQNQPSHHYGSNQSLMGSSKSSAEQKKIFEERRIVYVGRIETATTKEDLRKKFNSYGPIRQITIHYKDTGMKFGFVTFDNAKDAYRAIDCSTRDETINMYDVSFGGRRAFCKSTYLDLDGSQVYQHHQASYAPVAKPAPANDSFEELLRKMKEKLNQKRTSDPKT